MLVRFGDSRATRLVGLEPGRYRFKAFPDDVVLEPEEVVLGETAPAPIELRWRLR